LTVKIWPAIDSDPVRTWPVVFASTSKTTVPLPVPEAGLTTVIQLTLPVVVHEQPLVACTATLPVPPRAPND
jgi:hypothetical protein